MLSVSLVHHHQVPDAYKEAFLLSGYRKPCSSAKECVLSCVAPSNETLNVWTHLLPSIFFGLHLVWLIGDVSAHGLWVPSLPLLVFLLSLVVVTLVSSVAHCFSSVSPRSRHRWFFIDYAAIGFYSMASASAHYFYSRPLPTDGLSFLFDRLVYLYLAFPVHWIVFVLQCLTRHKWGRARYVVRTMNYVLAFLSIKFVVFARLWSCSPRSCDLLVGGSLPFHKFQVWANTAAGLINASKIPERFFPGWFDVVGHSHQWMHIATVISMANEYRALQLDLLDRMAIFGTSDNSFSTALLPLALPGLFAVLLVFGVLLMSSRLSEAGEIKEKTS